MIRVLLAATALLLSTSCGLVTSNSKSVFVLVDASGTYARNMGDAVISSRLLAAKLNPNDWMGFAQISSCSFSDEGVVLRARLPGVPSQASLTKQQIFQSLADYQDSFSATAYTDIRGALRFAAAELENGRDGARYIIVFSDLVEDVAPDCDTRDLALDLTGITVIATNVAKLPQDGPNPQGYFDRIDRWKQLVEAAGGEWRITASSDQLLDAVYE